MSKKDEQTLNLTATEVEQQGQARAQPLAQRLAHDITASEPTAMDVIRELMRSDVPADKCVAMMEGLQKIHHAEQDRAAERAFNTAFVMLQQDLPVFHATKAIQNRGNYLPYDDMMPIVNPLLKRHGFAISSSQDSNGQIATITVTLSHIAGHSKERKYSCRISPPQTSRSGTTDPLAYADGKASTTALRNAVCLTLNIIIDKDVLNEEHDAGMQSDVYLAADLAEDFRQRLAKVNGHVPDFLRVADATDFATIPASRYDELNRLLRLKEAKAAK